MLLIALFTTFAAASSAYPPSDYYIASPVFIGYRNDSIYADIYVAWGSSQRAFHRSILGPGGSRARRLNFTESVNFSEPPFATVSQSLGDTYSCCKVQTLGFSASSLMWRGTEAVGDATPACGQFFRGAWSYEAPWQALGELLFSFTSVGPSWPVCARVTVQGETHDVPLETRYPVDADYDPDFPQGCTCLNGGSK